MSDKNYTSNARLIQASRARGEKRGFEIYNNKFMRIASSTAMGNNRSYHLNLSMVDPKAVRHLRISWLWLVLFIGLGGTSFVLAEDVMQAEDFMASNMTPYLLISLVAAMATLVAFIFKSDNVTEFRTRFSKTPVISLMHNKPGRKEFKQFVEKLSKHAAASIAKSNIDDSRMASIELSEIRRLKDDGILKEKDYEHAKKKIMKFHKS